MNGKILIIDDYEPIHEVLERFLVQAFPDLLVSHALNGETAMEKVQNNYYDIVILEMKLMGINGIDIVRAIKAKDSDCNIIVISAWDYQDLYLELKEFSVRYLSKPFVPAELEELVRDMLMNKSLP